MNYQKKKKHLNTMNVLAIVLFHQTVPQLEYVYFK